MGTSYSYLFSPSYFIIPSELFVLRLCNNEITCNVVCRPLPPLPNLEVSDVVVEKAADRALVWINKLLAVGHDIAIKRDRTVFIQVTL